MAKTFIFRNNTIEFLFGNNDIEYSGYGDISVVPRDADTYIWFYQVPVKENVEQLFTEVASLSDNFYLVLDRIPRGRRIIVFTLCTLHKLSYVGNDFRLDDVVEQFNMTIRETAAHNQNVKVVDFKEFLDSYPSSDWIDWKYFFISQQIVNPRLAVPFKLWFRRKLDELALKRRKCIVLDLDNTLWGGVLGEDGIDGVKIGGDYPGKAFLYFQEALAQLKRYGVILAVCSKNNEGDVLELWDKNPFMVLKKEDFAAWRINWDNKVDNIVALSEELNIGLDSMVFVDDNPAERELVKQSLHMVAVPDFPKQPYMLPVFFKYLLDHYFRVYSVTDEDCRKTEQYKANALRARAKMHFNDFTEYLRSLGMKLTIQQLNDFNLQRIAQMTQKTNQFNLTTRRYSDNDIRMMNDAGCDIWSLAVADKFGDNGVTGLIIVRNDNIDTFLLSCRILGRGIEYAFLKYILLLLKARGMEKVYAQYVPTAKNHQVSDFYDRCGFTLTGESGGTKSYEISLKDVNLTIEEYYDIKIQ